MTERNPIVDVIQENQDREDAFIQKGLMRNHAAGGAIWQLNLPLDDIQLVDVNRPLTRMIGQHGREEIVEVAITFMDRRDHRFGEQEIEAEDDLG